MTDMLKGALIFMLKAPVHFYRYIISPLFPPSCRFSPSCSDYCLQALEKHGALSGLLLTFKRLGRCHPWSGQHGIDPVPEQHHIHTSHNHNHTCKH